MRFKLLVLLILGFLLSGCDGADESIELSNPSTISSTTTGRSQVGAALAQISVARTGESQDFNVGSLSIHVARITQDGSRVFFLSNSREHMDESGPYVPSGYPGDSSYLFTQERGSSLVELVTLTTLGPNPRTIALTPHGFSVSNDGRYLAFNLFDPFDPAYPDVRGGVYRLDRQTNEIKLVSRRPDGTPVSGFIDRQVSISGDGQHVAFGVNPPTGGLYNSAIHIFDCQTDTSEIVGTGELGDFGHSLSSDGSVLVFRGESQLPGDPPDVVQAYRLDRNTRVLKRISEANGRAGGLYLTDNGRFALFRAHIPGAFNRSSAPHLHRLMLYDAQTDSLEVVNLDSGGQTVTLYLQGVFGLTDPFYDMSEDGRYILFMGHSRDFKTQSRAVFLKDRQTGSVTRISAPTHTRTGTVPKNPSGFFLFRPMHPSMSSDGRWLFYSDFRDNPEPDERSYYLYLYDNNTGLEQVMNAPPGGRGQHKEAHSGSPSLTVDGSQIAFRSLANISDAPLPGFQSFMRTYLFRVAENTLIETSVGSQGQRVEDPNLFDSINLRTSDSLIAGDGSTVYIDTDMPLHGGGLEGRNFVYSPQTMVTSLLSSVGSNVDVSENGRFLLFLDDGPEWKLRDLETMVDIATGSAQNFSGFRARVSRDGQRILFTRNLLHTNGSRYNQLHLLEVGTGAIQQLTAGQGSSGIVSGSHFYPRARWFKYDLASDGRWAAFSSSADDLVPGDQNNLDDLFLMELSSQQVGRVQSSVEPDGPSYEPSLSRDGRFVAFMSYASNLVPDDTNGLPDVFLYDRVADQVRLLSMGHDGSPADGDSSEPFISDDGLFIAFSSEASNLTERPTRRGVRQVYRVANPFLSN